MLTHTPPPTPPFPRQVYGFQWRFFGAPYVDCHTDYRGQGVDQLAQVIDKILNKPYDRRIILTAWNPKGECISRRWRVAYNADTPSCTHAHTPTHTPHTRKDLPIMALPPCHMFCQFYVSNPERAEGRRPRVSCVLYQRSCDVGLGVPFNIASYALLTHMIAHVCDMDAGEFIHTMGDAHVYMDHVDALQVQMQRTPRPFPTLRIRTQPGGGLEALEKLVYEDLEVVDYEPHGKIAMAMSV